MIRTIIIIAVLALAGCSTTFHGQHLRPDGTIMWEIEEKTAMLVSRTSAIDITYQWLDEETNTLHEVRFRRFSDEKADAQLRQLEQIERLAAKGAGI